MQSGHPHEQKTLCSEVSQPLHHLQRSSQGRRESASAFWCRCPGRYWISKSKVLKNSIQRASCPSGSLALMTERRGA